MKYTIEYYQKDNDTVPVLEFLKSLENKKLRAKALHDIELLEEHGSSLKRPYVAPIVGDKYKGIFELRTQFSSNITRIFFFVIQNNTCILLHGFLKKTEKTPVDQLDRALKYKIDYERRCVEDD